MTRGDVVQELRRVAADLSNAVRDAVRRGPRFAPAGPGQPRLLPPIPTPLISPDVTEAEERAPPPGVVLLVSRPINGPPRPPRHARRGGA